MSANRRHWMLRVSRLTRAEQFGKVLLNAELESESPRATSVTRLSS